MKLGVLGEEARGPGWRWATRWRRGAGAGELGPAGLCRAVNRTGPLQNALAFGKLLFSIHSCDVFWVLQNKCLYRFLISCCLLLLCAFSLSEWLSISCHYLGLLTVVVPDSKGFPR